MTPLELQHTERGRLTDESSELLERLHPNILEQLAIKFEAEAALTI